MNVLVVGCGKVGRQVAETLSKEGHDVSVVDNNQQNLSTLDPDFDGMVWKGMPIDQDVLRNAGIESCDAVAVVTQSDNINIMTAQIAKKIFNVPKVIARVVDPERENVFSHFGLSTICSTRLTADAVISTLENEDDNYMVTLDTSTIGFSIRKINMSLNENAILTIDKIPVKSDEMLFGIKKEDGTIIPISKLDNNYQLEPLDRGVFTRIID